MTTFNPVDPSVWNPYFSGSARREQIASQRATTSSRTPGQVNRGVVYFEAKQIIVCPKCGRVRMDLGGPHSPHFAAGNVKVDCVGDPVVAADPEAPLVVGLVDGEPGGDDQDAHLERVSSRIAAAILRFAVPGRKFHADELRQFVIEAVGECAPGSADRVLRQLRSRGVLDYRCLNRKDSLYEALTPSR